jgi:23S rRNA A1618 N6-methylase RlmF
VFVVVALVFGMLVAIMDIVHVVSVLDLFVGAVRSAVPVLGECMFGLDFLGHDVLLRQSLEETRA